MKVITRTVWAKTEGRCWYCGEKCVKESNRPDSYTVDHVIPLSSGGENNFDNLVPCCKSCNSTKGTKTIEEFRFFKAMTIYHPVAFTLEQVNYLATLGFVMPMPVYQFYYEEINEKDNIS